MGRRREQATQTEKHDKALKSTLHSVMRGTRRWKTPLHSVTRRTRRFTI
jgi:hypothetical protein